MTINKKNLSERDICTKYITPALEKSGWDLIEQIREEVTFTAGKIYIKGNKHIRGKKKRADYILYYKKNIPIAVIEAKDNRHLPGDGIQQAINYSEILDIPFVFSSNGDSFIFHDKTISKEIEINLNNFPSPEELWSKYKKFKEIDERNDKAISQDYFSDGTKYEPRYYQQIAINKLVENVVNKKNQRLLLVMATGTGKTQVAFQTIYRLWKANIKKRILFLADRTSLIDQTVRNDFRHFKDAMTVIDSKNISKAHNIYLALYQGLTGNDQNLFEQFSKNFFDLIIVDECHRGSAREDSKWRQVLEYFDSATHIGLTATPKETKEVSSTEYFGNPIYTYSLKQGINDGFLAPYKVLKITLDIDTDGWRPSHGFKDKDGNIVEDRVYNRKDFDKNIVVEERREAVAKKITEYLKGNGRYSKSILFCVDIEHAEGMRRKLINLNSDEVSKNDKYVSRITGDNEEGKVFLDQFIDPSETYPVIATTSKLMTTGIDSQTCKLIILDSNIGSITEFKQIIGRGTRVNENYDKYFFTIMDFRDVTSLFADKEFDGEPIRIKEFKQMDDISDFNNETDDRNIIDEITGEKINFPEKNNLDHEHANTENKEKIYVKGIEVFIINERVQYLDSSGKLITEDLIDYTKKNILKKFSSLNNFLKEWNSTQKKEVIVRELEENGVLFDNLNSIVGKNFDPFDLVCHVAFDKKPLTRLERVNNIKKRDYFSKYETKAKKVIDALMDKYADEGILNFEDLSIINIEPINKIGTPVEIVNYFGSREKLSIAMRDLSKNIYNTNIN